MNPIYISFRFLYLQNAVRQLVCIFFKHNDMQNYIFIAFIPFDNIFSKFWTKNKPVQKLFIFFFLNVKDVLNHSNKLGIDYNECSFFHNEISMFLSNCFQKNLNEPYCILREVHEFLRQYVQYSILPNNLFSNEPSNYLYISYKICISTYNSEKTLDIELFLWTNGYTFLSLSALYRVLVLGV